MRQSGRFGSQAGFTLLELLVVLAVAALVAALIVPKLASRPGRLELASGARDVAVALRVARSRAVAQNQEASFVADTDERSFGSSGTESLRQLPRGVRLKLLTTSDQTAGARGSIRFYPDGSSSGGGVVVTDGALRYEVLVNWLDGGVSIHERQ
jgi:general secretion pathway protein H